MLAPFTGDYDGCYWNAQGLFAALAQSQTAKFRVVDSLIDKHDYLGLGETHSNEGKILAHSMRGDVEAFSSHGSNTQAGARLFFNKKNPNGSILCNAMTGWKSYPAGWLASSCVGQTVH